jgi:hypothetical protein
MYDREDPADVADPPLRLLYWFNHNRQIRAVRLAPPAGVALLGVCGVGAVVLIKCQHTGRAKLNTQPAAFAPHAKHNYCAARSALWALGWRSAGSSLNIVIGHIFLPYE